MTNPMMMIAAPTPTDSPVMIITNEARPNGNEISRYSRFRYVRACTTGPKIRSMPESESSVLMAVTSINTDFARIGSFVSHT